MDECIWQQPDDSLILAQNEVHVWAASLDKPEAVRHMLYRSLSHDEKERAARFRFDRDRFRYIVGRGVLRQLLGRYLGEDPTLILFDYGAHGKPSVKRVKQAETRLMFNVSHSDDMALFAFCLNREVGVDVERLRPLPDAASIAKHYFSTNEYERFLATPAQLQTEAFFNCWTRKEAYIKAIGDGLTHPLNTFDVTLRPGTSAKLLQVGGSAAEAAKWRLHSCTPATDFRGAVIAFGNDWHLHCWLWG